MCTFFPLRSLVAVVVAVVAVAVLLLPIGAFRRSVSRIQLLALL